MQPILLIFSILVSLIILVLILAIFTQKDYFVIRTVSISAASTSIFKYIKFLKNQDNYSKWAMMDPTMKKEYSGIDGSIGFIAAWESKEKNVGKGRQKICNLIPNKSVELEIQFIKPFPGLAKAELQIEEKNPNDAMVSWSLRSAMKYPSNITLLFLNMDKMIGNDLEIGLNNLKKIMESKKI